MANWQEAGRIELPTYQSSYDPQLYGPLIMQKQQQYDMGVEKIHGVMDSVAGLPVSRESDRVYLQNKVNELSSTLNDMVGADWSNQKMVSKVGRYANRLASDPTIQNAVISTKNIQALQKSQAELKEKHPERYTPQAEYEDQLSLERYLKSSGNEKFTQTTASQYYDYHEPFQKILKELHPSISYKITPRGQFEYIFDKSASITPNQIQELANGFFNTNPQYMRSVQLDAQYRYRGIDANQFQGLVYTGIQNQRQQLEALNDQYNKDLEQYKGNNQMTLQIQRKIEDNLNTLNGLNQKAQEYQSMFQSGNNLPQIKETFLMDQIRSMYGAAFQRNDVERSIEENKSKIREYEMQEREQRLYLDYVKAGIDPKTGQAITPGHPLYGVARASRKSEGGSDDALPTAVISGQDIPVLTGDKVAQSIEDNGTLLTELDNKLFQSYAQRYHNSNPKESLRDGFKRWKADQEYNITNGNPVNPDYLQFKRQSSEVEDNLSTDTALLQAAGEYAAAEVPGLSGIAHIGSGSNKAQVDLSDSVTVEGISRLNDAFKEWRSAMAGMERGLFVKAFGLDFSPSTAREETIRKGAILNSNYQAKVREELSKLPPDARGAIEERYLSVPERGLRNVQDMTFLTREVIVPSETYVENLNKARDKYLNDRALQENPEGLLVPTDEKTQNQFKAYAVNAHSDYLIRDKGDFEKSAVLPKDINVKMVYQHPRTGQKMIRYDYKGEAFDQPIASNDNVFGNLQNSNSQLYRNINLNPLGKLQKTTLNGKLRYEIGRSPFGEYYLNVLDGPNQLPITPMNNGVLVDITDPIQLVQRIEEFSKGINPETKKPYTRAEFLQLIANNDY